jgi:hypothetical protein
MELTNKKNGEIMMSRILSALILSFVGFSANAADNTWKRPVDPTTTYHKLCATYGDLSVSVAKLFIGNKVKLSELMSASGDTMDYQERLLVTTIYDLKDSIKSESEAYEIGYSYCVNIYE